MKMDPIGRAIVRTLIYADIFDYPLRLDQLHLFLIADKKITQEKIVQALTRLQDVVQEKDGYYFLRGRVRTVFIRKHREQHATRKIRIAHMVASYLFLVPTVRFVGISGNLAMENAQRNDDIDLFIIAQKRTIWLTRMFSVLLLDMLDLRRKRGSGNVADKICLNMFVDQSALSTPVIRQDLYTAHEIAQLLPIAQRKDTYKMFLRANTWMSRFLPNFSVKSKFPDITREKASIAGIMLRIFLANYFVEWMAGVFQTIYMRKYKTKEYISGTMLAFHPKEYRSIILSEYKKRLKNMYV